MTNQLNPAAHFDAYFSPLPCKGRFIICLNANIHSVHLPYRVILRTLTKNAVLSIFHPHSNMYSVCQTHSKDFKLWKIKDFSVILALKIH